MPISARKRTKLNKAELTFLKDLAYECLGKCKEENAYHCLGIPSRRNIFDGKGIKLKDFVIISRYPD